MSESTLDIFEQKADEEQCSFIEELASQLEITVDYYLMEFHS
jgi:hypothetical protein